MRFQPSWLEEKCGLSKIESIFFPISIKSESLMWFKKRGVKLFINDPLPSKIPLLKGLLENQKELFLDESRKYLANHVNKNPDFPQNPFKSWQTDLFSPLQLDFLYFWRETTFALGETQRNLLAAAVKEVISYWLSFPSKTPRGTLSPSEILDYFILRNNQMIFNSGEKVYVLQHAFPEISEEVESSLYLVSLREVSSPDEKLTSEVLFHAWWLGNTDLNKAKTEIYNFAREWGYSWQGVNDFSQYAKKSGKSEAAAFFWSSEGVPPKLNEEMIIYPIKKAFLHKFPKSSQYFKMADRKKEEYDFLLILQKN
ncbi:MAG: hypothetical protein HQM08_03085 [Candidatus Riflebacteria bacterium]|nr:hypothetical protein [Candidatus Riflebacteria bacterium]